ncbi:MULTISPECIES: hypothetical protein [Cyanophyceae]|uniref:hypothetical protein n=1 Tax=Cyanophyceae TaxID=3028117 RepID=UPI00016DCF27|nr:MULTISPECIES: hypothetical protein [Cyanophyceae]ACB01025.1 hypothetical protein SYNPCC7002_F0094 [Picosynechococcus sp. PCC 7002]SMH58697.1 hypothetical protein SAMN06272755_3255 [Picosynechococcus sp. OG1]SMQ86388.1 hypothetical protein SAMN06272774_3129 [Synechococcus sp. 7002]
MVWNDNGLDQRNAGTLAIANAAIPDNRFLLGELQNFTGVDNSNGLLMLRMTAGIAAFLPRTLLCVVLYILIDHQNFKIISRIKKRRL